MGKTIGEAAGFSMLLLIWILFLNMLKELNISDSKHITLIRKISLSLFGTGVFYLVLGGFFYNISIGQTGIFQYDVVWGYGNYARLMDKVEQGTGNGLFSMIYLLIARGIGTLFLNNIYLRLFTPVFSLQLPLAYACIFFFRTSLAVKTGKNFCFLFLSALFPISCFCLLLHL